ncbi:MAG: hypothetical protein M1815_000592 [Lichina confinis]|nr:MAG: hypothetical protein M1815_000592 [Lichina confinis]
MQGAEAVSTLERQRSWEVLYLGRERHRLHDVHGPHRRCRLPSARRHRHPAVVDRGPTQTSNPRPACFPRRIDQAAIVLSRASATCASARLVIRSAQVPDAFLASDPAAPVRVITARLDPDGPRLVGATQPHTTPRLPPLRLHPPPLKAKTPKDAQRRHRLHRKAHGCALAVPSPSPSI